MPAISDQEAILKGIYKTKYESFWQLIEQTGNKTHLFVYLEEFVYLQKESYDEATHRIFKNLAIALKKTPITQLTLQSNHLGFDPSLRDFFKHLKRDQLTHLDLSDNGIRYISNILEELRQTTITKLDLSWNDIDDSSMTTLAHHLARTSITNLGLSNNRFSFNAVTLFVANAPQKLKALDLSVNNFLKK